MVEFYYNCSINEATTHSPFEAMYGYPPSTLADCLLALAGSATTDVYDRLRSIADIRDVVNELLKLTQKMMSARSTRTSPVFQQG